ncbi:chitin deacetylase [Basidiobolus ranarum]|uniref:Chitin deacetylase n=1 Tax=Basidiobolus ranarum TaxID=34480 RepID=A0ABR2WRH4_9FUNG
MRWATFLTYLSIFTPVLTQDSGQGIFLECKQPGLFALTFDDGPGPFTSKLLKIFLERNVKATLFVLGVNIRNSQHVSQLKEAYAQGHQIALHTDSHPHLNTLSVNEIASEMKANEQAVEMAIGVRPNYMRPPYGECNDNTRLALLSLDYTVVNWNVDSQDWQYRGNPSEQWKILANIATEVQNKPYISGSYISLQHDTDASSVNATTNIIDLVLSKGYKLVTVAECLGNQLRFYKRKFTNESN